MNSEKPGILIRLSNLIMLQVLFIFAALVLVLFGSSETPTTNPESGQRTLDLKQVGQELAVRIKQPDITIDDEIVSLFAEIPNSSRPSGVMRLFRVATDTAVAPQMLAEAADPHMKAGTSPDDESAANMATDPGLLAYVADQKDDYSLSIMSDPNHSVVYSRVPVSGRAALVLVSRVDHDLIVSSRSDLQYAVLLLFLVSTLISLLTVYLIFKRLKEPIRRLVLGMEKTAQGEMYHMVVPSAENELKRLADAFNRMTQTLWENRRELSSYNEKLNGANLALVKSQIFLSTLFDSSPISVLVASPEGQIVLANRSAAAVFGCDADSMTGDEIGDYIIPSAEPLSSGNERDGGEALCRRSDGEYFPSFVIKAPVDTEGENPDAYLYLISDISESKSFQEMMIRLDRYCTRGEMAGDIAHEINNYLAVLSGNLELLPLIIKKDDPEKLDKKLNLMRETVDKIVTFGDGLMDTPQDEIVFERGNVNQVVENVLAFLRPQNRFDGIDISVALSPEIPATYFDQGQVQQMLVNLVFNAADALSACEGERAVQVRTEVTSRDGQEYVRVEVHDSGRGVIEEKVPDLFNERFTTKRKGHGIGLITCRRIVEAHNGHVGYRYDEGALFSFELPVTKSDCGSKSATSTSPETSAAGS